MGCNSSAVVPLVDSDVEDDSRIRVRVNPSTPVGTIPTERKDSFVRKTDPGALESAEPPEEILAGDFNLETKEEIRAFPPPLAFEIPAHENGGNIAVRHPPRRLTELERESVTHERMDEKQTEAKARRDEQLLSRMQTAQQGGLRRGRRLVHSDAFNEEARVASPQFRRS